MSGEDALYFFVCEQPDKAKELDILDIGASSCKSKNKSHVSVGVTSVRTVASSGADALSAGAKSPRSPKQSSQVGLDEPYLPVLHKLSAHSCNTERVIVDGKPIKLPFEPESNQFAIVRPLDARRSRELSSLNNLMFAVLKEVEVENKEGGKSKNRMHSLRPRYIESIVEIYQA